MSQSPVPAPADNWSSGLPGQAGTLQYAEAVARPAVASTLSITSIVIGSLGLLVNAYGVLMAVGMFVMAGMIGAAGNYAAVAGGGVTPAGLITPADAVVIADAMEAVQPLPAGHRQQLLMALPLADVPLAPPAAGQAWTQPHVAGQLTGSSSSNFNGVSTVTHSTPGDGSITIQATSVSFMTTPAGQPWQFTTVDANGKVMATATPSFNTNPFGSLGQSNAIFGITVEGAELLLAAMLLTAGILGANNARATLAWHRTWAWLRIVVALAGAFTTGIVTRSFVINLEAEASGWGDPAMLVTVAVGIAGFAFAAAYPVVVLVLLRSRRLRGWYATA